MSNTMSPWVDHVWPTTGEMLSAGKQLRLVQTGICVLEFLILPDATRNCSKQTGKWLRKCRNHRRRAKLNVKVVASTKQNSPSKSSAHFRGLKIETSRSTNYQPDERRYNWTKDLIHRHTSEGNSDLLTSSNQALSFLPIKSFVLFLFIHVSPWIQHLFTKHLFDVLFPGPLIFFEGGQVAVTHILGRLDATRQE